MPNRARVALVGHNQASGDHCSFAPSRSFWVTTDSLGIEYLRWHMQLESIQIYTLSQNLGRFSDIDESEKQMDTYYAREIHWVHFRVGHRYYPADVDRLSSRIHDHLKLNRCCVTLHWERLLDFWNWTVVNFGMECMISFCVGLILLYILSDHILFSWMAPQGFVPNVRFPRSCSPGYQSADNLRGVWRKKMAFLGEVLVRFRASVRGCTMNGSWWPTWFTVKQRKSWTFGFVGPLQSLAHAHFGWCGLNSGTSTSNLVQTLALLTVRLDRCVMCEILASSRKIKFTKS